MLQKYNVRTQDDFYRIYGVQQGYLDLFGIQLSGEDYTFANDESEIGEEGVYDPDNLPVTIESRTAMPAYGTTPRVYPKIMMPLTVIPSAPAPAPALAPALAPTPTPAPAPALAPAPASMFPRIPKYDVPSFFGTKVKPKR